jgi:hypothetical protein
VPIDYHKTFSDEAEFFRETIGMKSGFLSVGQAIEGTRGSLQRLTQQVKAADDIFTKSARRGEVFGVRALAEYTLSHNKINEVFSKSASNWTHGFDAVKDHAQGATAQLMTFLGEYHQFQHSRTEIAADYTKALRTQKRLEDQLVAAQTSGNQKKVQSLALRAAEAQRAAVIGKYELQMLEARKAAVPLMVMWGSTVGRVLEQSFELQQNFKDVNLDFASSVDLTKTLLTSIGSSQGLVTLKEAAETFGVLRSYSRDFLTPAIIGRIATFHELTGVSSESVAKILYQLKSIGGTMPDVNSLTNSFTYFARNTDLGAAGVSEMLGKMEPLITSYPKELRETLITEVLSLGDAFKRAGLNADEMLKSVQSMRDLTNVEGRTNVALISQMTGVNPMALMGMGGKNMSPAMIGYYETQTRRKLMQMYTQGGRMNTETAASLLSKRFGGDAEQWKIAGGKTSGDMSSMLKTIKEDKANAERLDNFNKALTEMTSGPVAKLRDALNALNRIFLETGTNILQHINRALSDFNKKFPAVHKSLSTFFHWMTDEKGAGFQWAIKSVTKVIVILTPVLGLKLVQAFVGVIGAGREMILTFRKLTNVIDVANIAANKYAGQQEKVAAETAASVTKGGIGGAELAIGGAAAGGGIFGWLGKLFGKGAAKEGAEIGGGLLEKLGIKGLLSFGGKALGKLAKGIPFIGGIIGIVMAIKDILDLWNDPKEHNPMGFFKMLLKAVGGVATFIPGWGLGISLALDGLVAALGSNADATKDLVKTNKDKERAEKQASLPQGGGAPLPTRGGSAYDGAGAGAGGGGGGGGGMGGYKPDVWDPILTGIANKYGINPRLLTSIGRAEGVAAGDFNPLGISPHGGGPTHYANVAAGAAGMEAYVKAHLPHFLEATKTGDIAKFAAWYSPVGASNDPNKTNAQEGANILHFMQNPSGPTASAGKGGGGVLGAAAVANRGMATPGSDPNLGCAASVSKILNTQGYNIPSTQSTDQLYQEIVQAGWQSVALGTPGSVVIAPSVGSNHGHAGIVGSDGRIYSNNSRTGRWTGDYTAASWARYFGGKGLKTYSFMPTRSTTGGFNTASLGRGAQTTAAANVLTNGQVQDHLENQIQAQGRRGKVALRANQPVGTDTAFIPASAHDELTASDRHGKAMLAELQAANRMSKERLLRLREQLFIGPQLMPEKASDDTMAYA